VELNRNQFFMIGIFLVLLGVQFRLLDSATLNAKTTQYLQKRAASNPTGLVSTFFASATGNQVIHPPQWIGWSLVSIGAVCILHSLAMKKPGG
jgi:hypothetical protein